MSIWAIIPVKRLSQSKSRLRYLLTAKERALLTTQLLTRLVATLSTIDLIEHILIVSSDKKVKEFCISKNILFLPESPPFSLNTALTQAYQFALNQQATQTLILPSDLPFITASDIYQILLTTPEHVPICSDYTRKGTNALLLPKLTGFRFSFGDNSFVHHTREIERHQLIPHPLQLPTISLDLDTEADWFFFHSPQRIKNQA